ncbi:peptidyl-prolyl cis-trans isomerase A (cyclophilin A) [Granulicella rosea]|uniref:Peptidyl-prolyl cis-trans isomerase n=1 Tax=Granulicella rosea TaxID=474952 RepID=A0A239IR28_9BACT|nr:peptidylprolyl isomerase [Granulicella rosea]SNS95995.1 peptidyl-prolyl cis-trans isomerase A (cyclophilin A) [Granulicella rosea]
MFEKTIRDSGKTALRLAFGLTMLAAPAALQAQAAAPAAQPEKTAPAATTPAPAAAEQFPDAPSTAAQIKPPMVPTGPTVVIDTTMGRLTCKLFEKEAPVSTANFIGLAEGTKDWTDPSTQKKMHGVRFYDGVTFHRVIPTFMIQGGDRLGNGSGDGGYFFDQEIVPGLNFDVAGRLAMANAGPNTNGTQFFITEEPQPDLDGKYNIFGQCDAHTVLLVASIARVSRNHDDKPDVPVVMNHVYIVRDGQPMPPLPVAPISLPAAPLPPQKQ